MPGPDSDALAGVAEALAGAAAAACGGLDGVVGLSGRKFSISP
jgi:hypothetical protein